jgi:hypothetical protein
VRRESALGAFYSSNEGARVSPLSCPSTVASRCVRSRRSRFQLPGRLLPLPSINSAPLATRVFLRPFRRRCVGACIAGVEAGAAARDLPLVGDMQLMQCQLAFGRRRSWCGQNLEPINKQPRNLRPDIPATGAAVRCQLTQRQLAFGRLRAAAHLQLRSIYNK